MTSRIDAIEKTLNDFDGIIAEDASYLLAIAKAAERLVEGKMTELADNLCKLKDVLNDKQD